jgi:hypothetical protein
MATSHPHLFQPSVSDENEVRNLVAYHFLPDRTVLQFCPGADEDILTPNTKEIVVFASFQCGFNPLDCDFLRIILDHYQFLLVHLNPTFFKSPLSSIFAKFSSGFLLTSLSSKN